jgi:hypothetical protein
LNSKHKTKEDILASIAQQQIKEEGDDYLSVEEFNKI